VSHTVYAFTPDESKACGEGEYSTWYFARRERVGGGGGGGASTKQLIVSWLFSHISNWKTVALHMDCSS